MGGRSRHTGVEVHRGALRIWFFWNGERCRESLNLKPTTPNTERAARLRAEIVSKISHGVFTYAEYFPDSKRAQGGRRTFEAVANEWFELQHELAKSTRDGYSKILNAYWKPQMGAKHVRDITPGDIKRAIKDCAFVSNKTRNNALSVAKLIYEYAVEEGYLTASPADRVKMLKVQRKEPDPFTREQMQQIITWMTEHCAPASTNYFRFAFASGMRTSELIDLRWSKVDLKARVARVDSAYVSKQAKGTKTYQARDIELTAAAVGAMEAQKALTYLAYDHVFLDPKTGRRYVGDKPPRLVFEGALKALGIRHRPAYNTRHTYATLALMAGANPMWVSRQLGHASLVMTMKHYARWIEGADRGRERDKLDAALGTLLGTQAGILGQ